VYRIARKALRPNVADPKIREKLSISSRKSEDMRRVLEDLQVTNHNLSRSLVPTNRAGRSGAKSMTHGW
jgi:hypothetical protein